MTDPLQVPRPARGRRARAASADSGAPQSGETGVSRRAVHHPFALGFFITLGGLVALLLGFAFSNLSTVIIYIVFAMFAALGLDPVVRLLERRGLSRTWSIVIVYAGFAIVLAAVLMLIIPTVVRQIVQFANDVPGLITTFQQGDTYDWLENQFGDVFNDLLSQVQTFLVDPGHIAAIGGGVFQVGVTIVSGISGGIIILVLSLYFLASLPTIKRSFYRLVPAHGRPRVADLTEQITDSIGGYLMGMVILALCNATFVFLMFVVLGLPFPLLLAVVTFCITLIPLVGTVLMWVIASVIALFADPFGALIFAIAYLVYMQVEAYVLTPRIMNRTISIPGALVVIGALVGGTLLGLLGALVAIPVTASVLLVLKQVVIPRQDAKATPDE
ncbi:AI-2E family transporter [Microbacterium sp. cx-55]|uniref:AI-2E family transporter n=1 Tax=Microbacterium sp. cx-55 TaxID=2875948 RepID=UPI001CBB07A3|nr:AI-2E family transporter [Microbacterium sp. cx-55]UGB35276.1 AI-2E family transporter [Microbacterium sp. cx-55]